MRYVTLAVITLTAVEAAWIFLDPPKAALWLDRSALLLIVLVALSVGARFKSLRFTGWTDAIVNTGALLSALASVLFLVVIVQEMLGYDPAVRHTPLSRTLAVGLVFALATLTAQGVRLAAVPGRDPLGLSERGRAWYAYAAELFIVLTLLHVRLNLPDWIPPILGRHWALAVMAVSFAGVGLSEWLGRRGLGVLAEPMRRSMAVLPWVAVLAYLARPVARLGQGIADAVPGLQPLFRMLERLPEHFALHALLWLLLGLHYAMLAWLRRSGRFACLAAWAGNFSVWVLLANHEDLAFTLHPQLWLIPAALILLATEQYCGDRLKPAASSVLLFLGLALFYLSSTMDMFITGLGNSVLLPVVLAVLAVLGVLTGILLHVRAYLAFGFSFLFLDVFAQIWHAAVDRHQTWVWWASGIVLGAAILSLFALFEKRRNDLLRLFAELKTWR